MPDKPVPLREALSIAIVELLTAHKVFDAWGSMDNAKALTTAEKRVDALLLQIPIVFEAREGEDS